VPCEPGRLVWESGHVAEESVTTSADGLVSDMDGRPVVYCTDLCCVVTNADLNSQKCVHVNA